MTLDPNKIVAATQSAEKFGETMKNEVEIWKQSTPHIVITLRYIKLL